MKKGQNKQQCKEKPEKKAKQPTMIVTMKATADHLKGLVPVYRKSFKVHNIFKGTDQEVYDYLKDEQDSAQGDHGGFVVSVADDKIVGGALVTFEEKDRQKHSRWKIKHLAVDEKYRGIGIGREILREAESMILTGVLLHKGTSAKVEISVSENESDVLGFYRKNGYRLEGKLAHHYRKDELCMVLGKFLEVGT